MLLSASQPAMAAAAAGQRAQCSSSRRHEAYLPDEVGDEVREEGRVRGERLRKRSPPRF